MLRWGLGLASVVATAVTVILLAVGVRRNAAKADGEGGTPRTAATQRQQEDWAMWNRRGKLSAGRGRADLALRQFERAIALNPDGAVLYANRGGAKLQLGDREGAIADCSLAIAKNPVCVEAWLNRAQGRAEAGDWKGAARDYERALKLLGPADWLRDPVRLRLDEARRKGRGKVY